MLRRLGIIFVVAITLLVGIFVVIIQFTDNKMWWIESIDYVKSNNKEHSKQIRVSIIDTGIDTSQSFLDDVSINSYSINFDNNESSSLSHGTKIASIICDRRIINYVNRNILEKLIINDIDIGEENDLLIDNLQKGIEKAIDIQSDIINISVGTYIDDPGLRESINNAINEGIIIICSAGDDSTEQYLYPASYKNVISVSGVDANKRFLVYNNRNDRITVCAPAENIELSYTSEKISGSSVAAALVTNMAIILKYEYNEIEQNNFLRILEKTSVDIGQKGKDKYYGFGFINMSNAIDFMESKEIKGGELSYEY